MGTKKKGGERKKRFLDILLGKRVIIQSRFGIIYEGLFTAKDGDYYILTDAKVVGRNNVAYVDLIGVKHNVIAHIHVEPKKVERLDGGG
jgi:small nuclear ribonucleoprotein (snRNP)-like protein